MKSILSKGARSLMDIDKAKEKVKAFNEGPTTYNVVGNFKINTTDREQEIHVFTWLKDDEQRHILDAVLHYSKTDYNIADICTIKEHIIITDTAGHSMEIKVDSRVCLSLEMRWNYWEAAQEGCSYCNDEDDDDYDECQNDDCTYDGSVVNNVALNYVDNIYSIDWMFIAEGSEFNMNTREHIADITTRLNEFKWEVTITYITKAL